MWEKFARLSDDQQETIAILINDIVEENVNPVNVATRDAARIVLARFEAAAETLSDDECAAELARYMTDVAFNMTPEVPGDIYIVTKKWTLKGLRFEHAREKFMESITCNVEGNSPTD
jgi:hypothetical protein